MRRLDGTVGRVACAVLTVLARRPRRSAAPDGGPRSILIIKLAEQGATVVANPALERAVELVGVDHVHLLVFAENRAIADELAVLRPQNITTVRTSSALIGGIDLLRALRRSRRLGIDAAVDFEFFSRTSAVLTYLTGARIRVGLHSYAGEGPWRGDLMTHRIAGNPTLHAEDLFSILVEATGAPAERLPTLDLPDLPAVPDRPRAAPIRPTTAELRRVGGILRRALATDDLPRLVVLNANAGDLEPLRRWPSERYVALAHRLLAEHDDVAIVLTGSPSEARDADELARRIGSPRCASVAGATTLRELLVLYSFAEVMVTNDSGPAHLAALSPMHVITLFGPETPVVFGSRSERSTALFAGVPCSPCLNMFNNRTTSCRDNICMQAIRVDEVQAHVGRVLAARSAGPVGSAAAQRPERLAPPAAGHA